MQHDLKCYKKQKERKENTVLANSWFAGNFSVKGILLTVCISCVLLVGLKKIEPCFLCFSCGKNPHKRVLASRKQRTGGHVLIRRNHTSKKGRAFVGNALIRVWRKSKKKKKKKKRGSLWLAVFYPITGHLVSDSVNNFNNIYQFRASLFKVTSLVSTNSHYFLCAVVYGTHIAQREIMAMKGDYIT